MTRRFASRWLFRDLLRRYRRVSAVVLSATPWVVSCAVRYRACSRIGRVICGSPLRGPYTYESGSRVQLGSGSNEPYSYACGSQSWESAHAFVVKLIRARLSSQARRAGLVRVWAPLDNLAVWHTISKEVWNWAEKNIIVVSFYYQANPFQYESFAQKTNSIFTW
jgi:hypothetical protein